jgi:microcystin-dependent protein
MPLSRLENFLKNVQGSVIYVNPEELDATDDISNTGNSRARPFKTIQRALLESARFSYQVGQNNDRFDKTTIMVSPGVHYIDNRPGLAIDTSGNLTDANGSAASINQFSVGTNFDIQDPDNVLYLFNSIHGGVILPRGTSIIGSDLRKTKIRPKYVPQPNNDNIPRSAVFRVTGGCFFFGFSLFDADPGDRIYRDFTKSVYSPNYSHHKLTCFEYADGVNTVAGKGGTDLDMYYRKLTLAYGVNSGRAIPDYPANNDFQATVDESRIVGAISQIGDVEIEDIYSGANPSASVATPVVTVVTRTNHEFSVGTPVLVFGVDNAEYDGSYVVSQIINDTTFTYSLASTPTSTANPSLVGKNPIVTVESDTVTSCSPYIFNCSVRSTFGLNGVHADGDKATGFKSMVIAQFTGIGLNKDDNAYVKYNTTSGIWQDQATLGTSVSLHTDSRARHKPTWQNFHVKTSNNSYIQNVSIFAIGYAQHFIAESGGDQSITNSNSNFGAKSLEADNFRKDAFLKDDQGYITEIIPAQKNFAKQVEVNYLPLDVEVTAGLSTDIKLYFYGYNQRDTVPLKSTGGYIIGNKVGETIQCNIDNVVYGATVLMPVPGSNPDNRISARKEYLVGRSAGINSITGNTFTLQENHRLLPGESIRVYSETGSLPDGLEHKTVYYAITGGVNANQIQIATTFNNALSGDELTGINNLGGQLRIVSEVADKTPGDPGHPIQYDNSGWHINVGAGNSLRAALVTNQAKVTPKTGNAFIYRAPDNRTDNEKIYRLRYVIPDNATIASPPQNGFSIEESGAVIDDTNYKNDNTTLTSVTNLRTKTNIINASWSSNVGVVTTQYPHGLKTGHLIEINRLRSVNNASGSVNSGFNGLFEVLAITDSKTFTIGLNTNPGSISTVTTGIPYTVFDQSIVGSGRTFSPYFVKKDFGPSYQIYTNTEVQKYKKDIQDGIYDLTILGYLKTPDVTPFSTASNKFSQNINDLIPAVGKDTQKDDPNATTSYALRELVGQVESSDPSDSISKEALFSLFEQTGIGIGITGASVSGSTLTINTAVEHGLSGISNLSIVSGGTNYGTNSGGVENYFNIRLDGGSGKGATANVTVSAGGAITAITLVDNGSGYAVGDTVTVRGVPFHAPGTNATATVSAIDNRVGDAIQVVGVGSTAYNGLFRVASIPNSKTITYTGTASGVSTGGFFYHVGIATNVVNITHDALSGIATVLLTSDIGLRSGDQIVIAGCTGFSTVYNGTHFVSERVGYGSSLRVNIGVTSNAPAYAGVATAHGTGISIRGRGRGIPIYDGVTTRLTSGITTTTTSITLANTSMLKRGDYLLIEDEIVRISNTGATSIIRGVLGSNAVPHDTNVAVRRINVLPVENRRYSILRASGHTFEYLGYGPGNYSTAMPQAQDRVLDDNAVLLAQSVQTRGGLVVYTGMNDTGDFYIGKSKINAVTGLSGATGGISDAASSEKSTFATLTVDDLTVNNNFYSKGNTEVVDLALKGNRAGDIAQTVYVGIQAGDTCPSSATDNILLRTTFTRGGYIGWVRTNEANAGVRWKRWGKISHECTSDHYVFDKIGIGITYCADQYQFQTVGISTFNGNIFITGITTHVGNVQVAAGSSFIGAGTIPVGGIIMWSGSIASIPTGWALCNGSSGTPDLRDRFIVGAGNNYSVAGVGGTTDSQLPAHTHNVTNGSANSFTAVTSVSDEPVNQGGGGSVNVADQESSTTFTIESAGISSTNQNLPPYYALAFIMRTV